MSRKKQIEIQKEFENKKRMERLAGLVRTGELLGNELITKLAEYGSSPEGLLIETYAISKAYGALRAIAEDKGLDVVEVFEWLLPSFLEEMREEVKNIGN